MSLDYLAAAENLVTQNQFNRLHIDLGNSMTPREFAVLVNRGNADELPEQTKKWLRRMQRFSPTMTSAPQPWLADDVSDRLTWYREAPRKGTVVTAGKPVLLAFCGNVGRLMLPLPVVLQSIPAAEWDILRITRIPDASYLRPGSEVDDLDQLITAIERELVTVGERRVTCLGTSSGGGPAMLAALRLNAQRCVSLCGNLPESWLPLLPKLSAGRLPYTGSSGEAWPDYLLVHGAAYEVDRDNAQRVQSLLGGHILPVPGVDRHNVLHALMQQERLDEEFNQLLHGKLRLGGILDDQR
jgi:hypothetical protein